MKQTLLTLGAVVLVIAGVITFRLLAEDASSTGSRAKLVQRCGDDRGCVDAVESHHDVCHEEVWVVHTHQGRENRKYEFHHGDNEAEPRLDMHELVDCIEAKAGRQLPTRLIRP